jgi:hypothetical protein
LSADFIADYLTTFIDTNGDPNSARRKMEIKGAIAYITNELLENAMKFSDESAQVDTSIQVQLCTDRLIFITTNSVKPSAVEPFQADIQELINCDPNELYIQRLEANATDEKSSHSGLGLLTVMSDYITRIGWKFEAASNGRDITTVTTMVQLLI